jgi:glucose-6-phosphate 1-dehydrogenase
MTSNPLCEENQNRFTEPCIVVFFGATGDLTARRLVPALYNLLKEGSLPSQFACVGFARRTKTDAEFRAEMREAVQKFSRTQPIDESIWKHFEEHLYYHQAEFHDEEGYYKLQTRLQELDHRLGTKGNRIFYLATPPSYFPLICEKLKKQNLIYPHSSPNPWSRVVIEKPFGHDLPSAEELQAELVRYMDESQIYRIDHWLGKETVQNLLVFRFANSIFESLWNNRYIDHVQITVAESLGIGTRGKLWEETGLVRDIVQNHVMQLVSLVAMEPPVNLAADSVHDEKVKVLQAIRPLEQKDVVRAQYTAGISDENDVIGYLQEKDVSPTSKVETFAALRLHIDNWRWSGTPFYLRAGKRLPKRSTEIAITFKDPPSVLFQNGQRKNNPNVLVIQIQPDEGISLKINCKVPGPASPVQPVKMDFKYGSYFGTTSPEAYERLIYDAIVGDSTLFARQDEVLLSWKLLSPIFEWWKKGTPNSYTAGSWGPEAADQLLEADGKHWRLI